MRGPGKGVSKKNAEEWGETTRYVVALRNALLKEQEARESGERVSRPLSFAIEEAAGLVLERCSALLLFFCDRLAASAPEIPGRARTDGADLAQEAWSRALRYLPTPKGAQIQDDLHLLRFLRVVARNRFLDFLDSAPVAAERNALALDAPESNRESGEGIPRSERIAGPETLPDVLRFVSSGSYGEIVDLLFRDEESFRRVAEAAGLRRHPRQYRAAVLHQLGEFFWLEISGATGASGQIIDDLLLHFAEEFHIPPAWWTAVASAVRSVEEGESEKATVEAMRTALLMVVNRLCGTSLRPGNTLSVLRYDLRQCAAAQDTAERRGEESQ